MHGVFHTHGKRTPLGTLNAGSAMLMLQRTRFVKVQMLALAAAIPHLAYQHEGACMFYYMLFVVHVVRLMHYSFGVGMLAVACGLLCR